MRTTFSVYVEIPGLKTKYQKRMKEDETLDALISAIADKYLFTKKWLYLFAKEKNVSKISGADTVGDWNNIHNKEKAKRIYFCLGVEKGDDVPLYASLPLMNEEELQKLGKGKSLYGFFNKKEEKLQHGPNEYGRSLSHVVAQYWPPLFGVLLNKEDQMKNHWLTDTDTRGNTPIMCAALGGHHESVAALIQLYEDKPIAFNNAGKSPLHYFAQRKDATQTEAEEMIHVLIDKGVSVYSRSLKLRTPVHEAVLRGNTETVKAFLNLEHFNLFTADIEGNTCLHLAVMKGDYKMVTLLKEYNAPLFVANVEGEFPYDMARRLANLSEPSKHAEQIKKSLKIFEDKVITAGLVERSYKAIAEGNVEEVKNIIAEHEARRTSDDAESIDISYKDMPFHYLLNHAALWAAARGKFQVLACLLEDDAINVDFMNQVGSLLFVLCQNVHQSEVKDGQGTKQANPDYLKALAKCVRLGADVNGRSRENVTCLHIAALSKNLVAVKFLLEKGAYPNAFTDYGLSELHYAILGDRLQVVECLLKGGSDPDYTLRRYDGMNAMEFTKSYGTPRAIAVAAQTPYSSTPGDSGHFENVADITVHTFQSANPDDTSEFKCILTHALGEKACQKVAHLNNGPPVSFCIREKKVYFRHVIIDVKVDHQRIGRATITLDLSKEYKKKEVAVNSQRGQIGTISISIAFKKEDDTEEIMNAYKYSAADLERSNVEEMIKSSGGASEGISVGLCMKESGFVPKYPIIIVPGLASSALEVNNSENKEWLSERVWIDPKKFSMLNAHVITGAAAGAVDFVDQASSKVPVLTTFKNIAKGVAGKVGDLSATSAILEILTPEQRQEEWMKHMLLKEDGITDPDGIFVRPGDGLKALNYLIESNLMTIRYPSYVFGPLIDQLCEAGYCRKKNLAGAPYDWRLPPAHVQTRDGYFSDLMHQCESFKTKNNERVVLMGHSMGNRTIQYFFQWLLSLTKEEVANHTKVPGSGVNAKKSEEKLEEGEKKPGQIWIDTYIHAFCALGAPFLGAPKTVRSVISGDQMGLESFIDLNTGKELSQGCASVPFLFPEKEELYPDPTILRVFSTSDKDKTEAAYPAAFEEKEIPEMVKKAAKRTDNFIKSYYDSNPLYADCVTEAPPVENLWSYYGINLNTEISYYYTEISSESPDVPSTFKLDKRANQYSNRKIQSLNPSGLMIDGGIGYETRDTFQRSVQANKSGDGTVPYCSLSYADTWAKMIQEGVDMPLKHVEVEEFDTMDHREMLSDNRLFERIIQSVCEQVKN